MLKAFKGLKKRLGSSSKLHEEGAAADAEAHCVAAAAAAPASAAAAAALPRAGQAAVTDQAAHAEQQAGGTYAVAPPSSAPVATGLPPRPRSRPHSPTPHAYHHHSAHPLDESGGELAVDYELVAGPLELDGSLHDGQEHCVDGEERGGGGEAGAGSEQHQHHHGEPGGGAELQHEGQHPWHDSAPTSGDASTDEEAGPGAHAGDGGAAADAGSAAAAAAAAAEGIADALATMMYLTEDAEGAEDCVSVVSGAPPPPLVPPPVLLPRGPDCVPLRRGPLPAAGSSAPWRPAPPRLHPTAHAPLHLPLPYRASHPLRRSSAAPLPSPATPQTPSARRTCLTTSRS